MAMGGAALFGEFESRPTTTSPESVLTKWACSKGKRQAAQYPRASQGAYTHTENCYLLSVV